jgi:hypothetical protein
MPKIGEIKEWRSVSFPELLIKLGKAPSFSLDHLVEMIAAAESKGEDFRIVNDAEQFFVPLNLITEYLQDRLKPKISLPQKAKEDRIEPKTVPVPFLKTTKIPVKKKMSPVEIVKKLKHALPKAKPARKMSEMVKKGLPKSQKNKK